MTSDPDRGVSGKFSRSLPYTAGVSPHAPHRGLLLLSVPAQRSGPRCREEGEVPEVPGDGARPGPRGPRRSGRTRRGGRTAEGGDKGRPPGVSPDRRGPPACARRRRGGGPAPQATVGPGRGRGGRGGGAGRGSGRGSPPEAEIGPRGRRRDGGRPAPQAQAGL